jgi:RNA polymerase sigma-70 factor (ECF subfamily)
MTTLLGCRARSVTGVGTGEPQDVVLLARIRAGDERALSAVYDQHSPLVFGLAKRVTRDEQLARDITQEVFTYLWELPDRVDLDRGSLRAYLVVVAHRRAVDEVRRSERRAKAEALDMAETLAAIADGPEDEVVEDAADSWLKQRLRAVLAQLSDEQRAAIKLAYYEGLTYRQVGQALGIPEGTAKSRLRLALNRLRALLEADHRAVI